METSTDTILLAYFSSKSTISAAWSFTILSDTIFMLTTRCHDCDIVHYGSMAARGR